MEPQWKQNLSLEGVLSIEQSYSLHPFPAWAQQAPRAGPEKLFYLSILCASSRKAAWSNDRGPASGTGPLVSGLICNTRCRGTSKLLSSFHILWKGGRSPSNAGLKLTNLLKSQLNITRPSCVSTSGDSHVFIVSPQVAGLMTLSKEFNCEKIFLHRNS